MRYNSKPEAEKEAKETLLEVPNMKEWKINVWENLGWHFALTLREEHSLMPWFSLHKSDHDLYHIQYCRTPIVGKGSTPQEALQDLFQELKAKTEEMTREIEDINTLVGLAKEEVWMDN